MKYLCDFRLILHTWTEESDGTEWNIPQHELLHSAVWDSRFLFRSKQQKHKDNMNISFWLNSIKESDIKIEQNDSFINEHSMRAIDYSAECIENYDVASLIVENDLKDSKGEKYYEVIGKLHEHASRDYWGEDNSDIDIEDLLFQEIDEKDVEDFCKHEGIRLINKEIKHGI